MTSTRRIRVSVVIFALAMGLTLFSKCSGEIVRSRSEAFAAEIRLNIAPFDDPTSRYLHVRDDGKAYEIKYNRYQLTIVSRSEGKLSQEDLTDLLRRTQLPEFRKALQRKDYGGEGLSRGNQFHLSLKATDGTGGEIFGFAEDAPTVVRTFIEQLLALDKNFQGTALNYAYLRGKPIAKGRFDELRREARLRFVSISELQSPLHRIVTDAINQPDEFFSLTQAQYGQLLALTSHGHDFFIVENGKGHQLTLFQSAK
jgi:hypothetical protein